MDHGQDPESGTENDEERVGYGNPPKHTRWRPGYCPNPAGRPRKAKGRRPILERIANELVEVKVGGSVQRMARAEIVLMAVRNAMANGNPVAQQLCDKLLNEVREEGAPVRKGVLIIGEKLSAEEWTAEFDPACSPLPRPIQMADCAALIESN